MLDAQHGNPAVKALGEADRALVRAIVQTALRYLPRIELILSKLLQSPLPPAARSLHHLLVTAAAQVLYLDVPDHSAVDLAVELAHRDPRNRRFAKLVNAVLRRLVREKAELLAAAEPVMCLPDWFQGRLSEVYGRDETARIAAVQLVPAAIDLTVKADPDLWAERLNGKVLPTGSVRLAEFRGSIAALEGYDEGAWWVQDAAASIPARLFGNLQGKRVADLCAAPGGKTAQLVLAGAMVTAVEQSASRLERLKENFTRLGLDAECVKADLLDFKPESPFDAVLLDAPCSSTGTIRRHPDVLWTKGPDDIAKLAKVQENLLLHAVTLVRPGGLLVFSNCSLDPSEGEDMIARVLSRTSELRRVAVLAEAWPGLEEMITPLGEIRTTPAMLAGDGHISGGMDGFYACLLSRN